MNTIREVLALAEFIQPPVDGTQASKIEQLETRINHIGRLLDGLWKIEEAAREALSREKWRAGSDLQKIREEREKLQTLANLTKQFKHLNFDALRWRNAQGLPRLAIFELTHSTFKLIAGPNRNAWVDGKLPLAIKNCYQDVLQILIDRRSKQALHSHSQELHLTVRFEGLIPQIVKDEIKRHQELKTFDTILIIAEPEKWVFDMVTPMPQLDPLVVGYKKDVDPEGLWLITEFDITPVEQAVLLHSNRDNN